MVFNRRKKLIQGEIRSYGTIVILMHKRKKKNKSVFFNNIMSYS